MEDVLTKALALVQGCPCEHPTGCPGCVSDFRCSDYNVVLDKASGIVVVVSLGGCGLDVYGIRACVLLDVVLRDASNMHS